MNTGSHCKQQAVTEHLKLQTEIWYRVGRSSCYIVGYSCHCNRNILYVHGTRSIFRSHLHTIIPQSKEGTQGITF